MHHDSIIPFDGSFRAASPVGRLRTAFGVGTVIRSPGYAPNGHINIELA
jgi:hypothetical protein